MGLLCFSIQLIPMWLPMIQSNIKVSHPGWTGSSVPSREAHNIHRAPQCATHYLFLVSGG